MSTVRIICKYFKAIEPNLPKISIVYSSHSYTSICFLFAGYKGASDLYIDSNIQLALAAAKQIAIDTGKSVHILLPDETEYRRAYKM